MKHFLVTRFNIRFKEWETTKNGEKVLTDEWMEHRFRLFENYCLPSVMNQSNQNFIWCIFFDKHTKNKYTEKISYYIRKCGNIYPIYLNDATGMIDGLKKTIKNNISEKDKFVITTRMDNDDILHKDFIKTIQDNYIPVHSTVIDLREGYQVYLKKGQSEIRKFDSPFNQFVSIVEIVTAIETVFSRQHPQWEDAENVVIVEKYRLWIELVHNKNKLSQVLRYHRRISYLNNTDFGIVNGNAFVESPIHVFFYNTWTSIILPCREGLKRILKQFKQ